MRSAVLDMEEIKLRILFSRCWGVVPHTLALGILEGRFLGKSEGVPDEVLLGTFDGIALG